MSQRELHRYHTLRQAQAVIPDGLGVPRWAVTRVGGELRGQRCPEVIVWEPLSPR